MKVNTASNISIKLSDQHGYRRLKILSVILISILILSFSALIISVLRNISQSSAYEGIAPPWMAFICFIVLVMYKFREKYTQGISLMLVILFVILGTIPILIWGIMVPEAQVIYALTIVIAGVIISARSVAFVTFAISMILLATTFLEMDNKLKPDLNRLSHGTGFQDSMIFLVTFSVIATVAWLSNREIERSQRKAMLSEIELSKERDLLEVRVSERTKELEQTRLENDLHTQRFIEIGKLSAGLIHDLSSPLTAVSLNLDSIDREDIIEEVEQAQAGVKYIEKYINSLKKQLLQNNTITEFNPRDEFEQVIEIMRYKASKHKLNITLTGDKSVQMCGDAGLFSQVAANLLANAIDSYDDFNSTTNIIDVKLERADAKHINVVVTDRGKGLHENQIVHIFKPFYTSKASKGGYGLGLALIKHVVETKLNGKVRVDSELDKGTSFELTLPIQPSGRVSA